MWNIEESDNEVLCQQSAKHEIKMLIAVAFMYHTHQGASEEEKAMGEKVAAMVSPDRELQVSNCYCTSFLYL